MPPLPADSLLFEPYRLGTLTLRNRMVMAPMTRNRAGAGGVPTPLNAVYYAQRASAGLIVTEATPISPQGVGYIGQPGIWTGPQAAGWSLVTRAVHDAGGLVFLQLFHAGRISHVSLQPSEDAPLAPSPVRANAHTFTARGPAPASEPRALEAREIPTVVEQFADATCLARLSGFDGVEIHAANGYLIDQFLRDGSNRRLDRYGGSLTKRARFLLEVVEAVKGAWSAGRVGVRLSPRSGFNDMADTAPAATFTYVSRELSGRNLAYLHLVEPIGGPEPDAATRLAPLLRKAYRGSLILNGGYDGVAAHEALAHGEGDLVSFGAPFLANPDLPERLRLGEPLNTPDPSTFYGGGEEGYTDYPGLAPFPR